MKKSIKIILCVCFALITYSLCSGDKPKTVDPLDHMAAISGLLTASTSTYLDKETRKKYELHASCLASRLISEKDEDEFFFTMRQQGGSLTYMLVRPQLMPKEPHYFDRALAKARLPYRIAEFNECKLDKKRVFVYPGFEYLARSSKIVVSPCVSPGTHIATRKLSDDCLVCKYYIRDKKYRASNPLGRSCYPNHQILLKFYHDHNRVVLYAIPHDDRYKDKDV